MPLYCHGSTQTTDDHFELEPLEESQTSNSVCDDFSGNDQQVTLCVLPLYHIYAMNVTMTSTLVSGGQLVMLPKFEPQSFIKALEKYRPTFLHLAPPLLAFCADHDGVKPEVLKGLHHVLTAAAPTGPTLLRRFKKKAPGVIVKEGQIKVTQFE